MSYIVFTTIALIGIVVFFVIALIQTAGEKAYEESYPYIAFEENGNIVDTKAVESIGGWIEQLDENNDVIEIFGKKQTETKKYAEEELLDMMSQTLMSNYEQDFYSFYHKQGDYKYLIFYPADKFNVIYSVGSDEMVYTDFNKGVLLGLVLFLLLEVVAVSVFVTRKITKPMEALSGGMERVAAGEEEVDIPIYREKEFAGIQSAFQNMTRQLQEQKAEKEEIIRRRQQMLLELSHDIKTPVSTIKSYAYALSEHMVPEEQLTKYYTTIATKADRVNQLTVDLFTLLKMESEGYQVEQSHLNFSEMIRTVLTTNYEEITNEGFDLDIEMPEEDFFVDGDERYLTRVVENLLFNAKKYNKTGHQIKVEVAAATGDYKVSLKVKDDGIEIDKEIQDTMFLAFVRGEKSRKSDGGTGLGLAITKQIVDKHNGQLQYSYQDGFNCFEVQL
ncbi:MAG: HAMP domain-containing sensor histidine kinase [Eubacteriales bacterium]|nr:HAMP domain-containing sensor histidine kinase [Eubacteriales bacterium]